MTLPALPVFKPSSLLPGHLAGSSPKLVLTPPRTVRKMQVATGHCLDHQSATPSDDAASAKKKSLHKASANPKPQGSSSASSFSGSVSRPSPSLGRGYEVFLSFRGADTRKGFVDCLYHRLREAGIDVFRDNEELHVGEKIGPELLDRIERSKIAIPVFSENYASSKWCLRELACMMDCRKRMKQTVLPIFYKVTPDEVQHQSGSYEAAFAKHVEDSKHDSRIDVPKWREALEEVGTLKGWDLQSDTNGHEGELIIKVVQRVVRDLKKGHILVTKNLVSVDDKKTVVMRLLDVGSADVRIVGLYGIGGIGKTTLAKVIYNEIMDEFGSCSFLQDIGESSLPRDGLKHLQSRLAADLSRCQYQDFATIDEGIAELQRRFREKKVLIVLDDVDDNHQLEMLVSVAWFAPGSRVIVTTRYKNALSLTPEELRYEVKEMELDQSMELFCKHAFRIGSPSYELSTLSEDIVQTTGGLPLALEVIGSSLYGERKAIWEETLEKLREKPHTKVEEKLRISYDSLEPEQKKIFLDIACIFVGQGREIAMLMWEDCKFYPESGLDKLVQRSLVKVMDDNTLWMHDQLRDLGREIVRKEDEIEPGNRTRLWRSKEAVSVLKTCKGSANVEAICVEDCTDRLFLTDQNFRNMSRLRFLQMDCVDLQGNFENMFTNLRCLRWQRSSSIYRLSNLDLRNLVVLDLSWSIVDHDREGWKLMQRALKLQVLSISCCWGLTVIDPSIRCLPKSLTVLSVICCVQLCFLNVSNLGALRKMHLHQCVCLQRIEGLDRLVALEKLFVTQCVILKLPDLSKLKSLSKMKVDLCFKLQELEGLDELVALEELSIRKCTEIEKLPNLSKLKYLRKMKVYECEKLRELEGLDELVSLEELCISQCGEIKTLPNLSKLKALRELHVLDCKKLQGLDGLDGLVALEVLIIDGCTEVDKVPNLLSLKSLEYFSARDCEKLQGLGGLEAGEALEVLQIRGSR